MSNTLASNDQYQYYKPGQHYSLKITAITINPVVVQEFLLLKKLHLGLN